MISSKKMIKYCDYMKNYLVSIIVFMILFVFDIVVLICVNNYFSKPFISKDYVRESGYSASLIRNGFVLVNNKYYYCDENALIVKDQIINWEDQEYYLDDEGVLITNKKNFLIQNNFYDIDENGVLIKGASNK